MWGLGSSNMECWKHEDLPQGMKELISMNKGKEVYRVRSGWNFTGFTLATLLGIQLKGADVITRPPRYTVQSEYF